MYTYFPFFLLIMVQLFTFSGISQTPLSLIEPTIETKHFNDYQGSIYNSLRFKKASINEEKSGSFDTEVRYNMYTDQMEYSKDDQLFMVKQDPSIHIRIDDEYFYYCNFTNKRFVSKRGYYVLVELSDNYAIYKKYDLEIIDPKKYGGTDGTPTPGVIKVVYKYYLEEDGIIMELPLNKREMLALFSDKEQELNTYIKKNKLKLRKEEDIIQLVSKYNMLKSDNIGPSRSLLTNSN